MFIYYVCVFLIALYFYATRKHNYWIKRNVKHDPPIPLFGNNFLNLIGCKSATVEATELYKRFPNEKVVGYYRGTTPELIIRDPDLIRQILNLDFQCFYKRGYGRSKHLDPLFTNLFTTDDDTWRLLRQRLTPAFTTAKLKKMFPLVVKCAEKLQIAAEKKMLQGEECDMRELMAGFTTEFIGVCGFGIEMDTINNEKSLFRDLGKRIFTRTWKDIVRFAIWELIPEVRNVLRVSDPIIEKIIIKIVSTIRQQRNFKPSGRNDFIDLLLELEQKGKMVGESMEKKNADGTPAQVELDMDLRCQAAQVFVFFAAGFETSSTATSIMLHEIAFHPEEQARIQTEIDQVLSKYDGKFCYDAISEMNLLDMAFKESMRIFSTVGVLNRECTTKYKFPELGFSINPGVKITIPVQAIHMDEQYYEDPEVFRPERFASDEIKERNNYLYMPFGEGPRACIGARLGHMQSLAGLAAVLHKFTVEPAATTRRRPCINHKMNVVQGIHGGLPLKLTLRNK